MNNYQFNQIIRTMKNEHPLMEKGEERRYELFLERIERQIFLVRKKYDSASSIRATEAICLVLFKIKGYLTDKEFDTSNFENEDNLRIRDAILNAIDPFTNKKIADNIAKEGITVDIANKEFVSAYFELYIKCLLRLYDSMQFWIKDRGSDGYFSFLMDTVAPFWSEDESEDGDNKKKR